MKRIINVLIAGMLLLSPLALAKTAPFFKIVEAGTPAAADVILCLNGTGSLSCQNYHFSAQDVRISTTAVHHYPAVGIKVLTPGYRVTGCTPYPNGYCLFAASNTASAALHLSPPKNQTIIVTTPPPASAIYNSRFTVAATATSGLPVTFSSSGSCTNSGVTYTMISGTGICNVIASQPGNADYNAAPTIHLNTSAQKKNQTIIVTTPPPASAVYNSSFNVAATATSGLSVMFSSSGSCTNSGATYTMTSGTGVCNVLISQSGSLNYSAASTVTDLVTATQASQTTLTASATPSTIPYFGSSTLSTTGGSGIGAVAYAVTSGSGNCSISGTTLTGIGGGSCSVTATKAADANYQSAASLPITVTVTTTVPGAPTGVAASAGYESATVSWSAPANTGGVAITSYIITPYIGATAQPTTTVGNVLTTNITGLTNGSAYTFVVRAVNSVGTGSASAASNQVTPLADGTYTVPAFPRTVIATAGPSTVTLTWAAPNNPLNGAVTGYTVLYGQTSTATYIT